MRRWITTLPLVLALAGPSCMPPIRMSNAFSSRFGDNDRARLVEVLARVGAGEAPTRPSNSTGQPLVAAVTQQGDRAVTVYDVASRRALWSQSLAASGTPEILGDALVIETGTQTRILDLATGSERGRVEHTGLDFVGAARDGDTIVMSLSAGLAGGSHRAGRVVAVSATSGSERWSHDVGGIVGRPAARGGLAFVPWDRQSIAILEMSSGVEKARLRSTDDVLSWVFASPLGIFYGGRGVYQLTPESASGTRAGSAYLANPLEGVPGDPMIYRDGFLATTGTRNARDKIRFAFAPRAGAEAGHVSVEHDTIFLGYYHDVLAIDASTGTVRWAVKLDEDLEAMQATHAGLFVLTGGGKLHGVNPSNGAISLVAEVGANLGAFTTDLDGLALPTEAAAPEGGVREQLLALVRDPDNRLVPFRSFLVGALAHREEPEVTRDLLDLYTQRSIPNQLRQAVATALQTRRTGAPFLVAALNDHYDYLEGRLAPPLQVIAPTLVAMNARDAVPGLLAHLLDHETPAAALPEVVHAVSVLGEASVVDTLKRWVQMYRADSSFQGADNVVPLQSATDAIFTNGDQGAREWLQQLAAMAGTNALVKTHIEELFARQASDEQHRTAAQSETERVAALQAELNRLHEAQDAVPAHLTDESFDEVWNAHLDEIRECAQGAVTRNPQLNQIRVVITLRGDFPRLLLTATPPAQTSGENGANRHATTTEEATAWVQHQMEGIAGVHASVRLTTYSPNDAELRACMDHVLPPLPFPAFRELRQEFRRVIDTRASRPQGGGEETFSGLGTDTAGRELPWWLVSAPTLEVENPVPVNPAQRPTTPTTPVGPSVRPTGPTPSSTPSPSGPAPSAPPVGTGPAQRPWWEE